MFGFVGRLFRRPPAVPTRLTIEDAHYCLDGGTTALVGRDEHRRKRHVELRQHMFPGRDAGRLFLDWYRVPMRGPVEAALLAVLWQSLDEVRSRPVVPADDGPPLDALRREGALIIGAGMADLLAMPHQRRLAAYIASVIGYVQSPVYGTVTDEYDPSSSTDGIVLIRPGGGRWWTRGDTAAPPGPPLTATRPPPSTS